MQLTFQMCWPFLEVEHCQTMCIHLQVCSWKQEKQMGPNGLAMQRALRAAPAASCGGRAAAHGRSATPLLATAWSGCPCSCCASELQSSAATRCGSTAVARQCMQAWILTL